jgi:hypothetical protein
MTNTKLRVMIASMSAGRWWTGELYMSCFDGMRKALLLE